MTAQLNKVPETQCHGKITVKVMPVDADVHAVDVAGYCEVVELLRNSALSPGNTMSRITEIKKDYANRSRARSHNVTSTYQRKQVWQCIRRLVGI